MQTFLKQNTSQPAWDFSVKPIVRLAKTEWAQPSAMYTNASYFTNSYITEVTSPITNGSKPQLFLVDKVSLLFAQVVLLK